MGISIEFKEADLQATEQSGWHVWERDNRGGRRRESRTPEGFETLVGFVPERLLSYAAVPDHQASLRHYRLAHHPNWFILGDHQLHRNADVLTRSADHSESCSGPCSY